MNECTFHSSSAREKFNVKDTQCYVDIRRFGSLHVHAKYMQSDRGTRLFQVEKASMCFKNVYRVSIVVSNTCIDVSFCDAYEISKM